VTVAGLPAAADRLEQAVAAFLRQEFEAPVAAISGFIEILLEDARGQRLDDFVADLERMQAAAGQLSGLVARVVARDGEFDQSRLRHDLRTPLTAIKGYGELLVEEARESGHEGMLLDLGKVLDLAERLLEEIDKLLTLARDGGGPAAQSPLEVVHTALQAIKPLAGAPERHAISSRILVVDDNPANRDLLSRRLLREGHLVATAESGPAALALAAGQSFDLVLLDLMMPGMSGFEVLCRLKAEPQTRHVPVIMVSALDEIDSTVRCLEAGAEDYLPKPFNPVLLRARIGACLEKKHLRDREQAIAEELRAEKERSEALLRNILPRTIIERMRRGETVIADHIDEATILFSDLVGFTELAARLPAGRTIELLGLLFSRFDELAAAHGLEKIKTIGDAYMVAGGIPEKLKDHATAMAEMALAMLDCTAATSVTLGEPLQLRIGLHTGALIAGVIGTHKFVYDVWGDTVNTASRMENLGLPGRIHVSAATRQALGDAYRFEPRGALEVKGKGMMETYFLCRDR
jgi:adenylate cyclase